MTDPQQSPCGNLRQLPLKPSSSCQEAGGSWYFRLSVRAFSFLSGIVDVVVVARLYLIANRKLIEQACCDYIL